MTHFLVLKEIVICAKSLQEFLSSCFTFAGKHHANTQFPKVGVHAGVTLQSGVSHLVCIEQPWHIVQSRFSSYGSTCRGKAFEFYAPWGACLYGKKCYYVEMRRNIVEVVSLPVFCDHLITVFVWWLYGSFSCSYCCSFLYQELCCCK